MLEWEDVLVLAVVLATVRGLLRKLWAIASVLLVAAAFPPWSLPTWWCCLTPLLPLWRGVEFRTGRVGGSTALQRSWGRDLIEALTIGFAMCWLTTGFVRDAVATRGALLQGSGCSLFGMQMLLFPLALRRLGERTALVTAAVMTVVATLGEWLQASVMNGVTWSMMAFSLPVAETPLAQWAAVITPFGVSALLYLVNFLWLPARSLRGWKRWQGSLLAAGLMIAAWISGQQIASSVSVPPLGFSAMLVQPHLRGRDVPWRPWVTLDRLTREGLLENAPVDLIVWPETTLVDSWQPGSVEAAAETATVEAEAPLTLQGFQRMHQPIYRAACLVGVPLISHVVIQRYGLEMTEAHRVNAACLVGTSGEIVCHEKLSLLPIREGLPEFLDTLWVRQTLLPYYRLEAGVKPGHDFNLLPFSTQDGRAMRIAASICYESYLPWLPQFRKTTGADAVIHLVYDGDFAGHPGWGDRHLLACRYRAIESRKWNLVCSTWSGSAIIDPAGNIVARLPAKAGVLRTHLTDREEQIASRLIE